MARRWTALLLVAAGAWAFGVRGACFGLLAAELAVLALGLLWARPHVAPSDLRVDTAFLAPYVRFGLAFFGSNLLVALALRAGEPMVRAAAGGYAAVGHFGLASAAALGLTHGLWQVLLSFLPLLSLLRHEGDVAAIAAWSDRLLRAVVAAGMVGLFAALLLSREVVSLLAGPDFLPAAALFLPLGVAILAQGAGGVGRLLTVAFDRPRLALLGAALQAGTLAVLGLILAGRHGPYGVALAMAAGALVQAVTLLLGMRRTARLRLRPALGVAALGGLHLPLAAAGWPGLGARLVAFVALVVSFAVALRAARLVSGAEWRAIFGQAERAPSSGWR
jgi:O-antigen/teichoic acid export membrane protein